MTIPKLLEKDIKRVIIAYLRMRGVFCWVNTSVGVWDEKKNTYRRMNGAGQMKGTADILGIFNGKPLAIEVKSAKGVISLEQAHFLNLFRKAGGIAFVARSVDDVVSQLPLDVQ